MPSHIPSTALAVGFKMTTRSGTSRRSTPRTVSRWRRAPRPRRGVHSGPSSVTTGAVRRGVEGVEQRPEDPALEAYRRDGRLLLGRSPCRVEHQGEGLAGVALALGHPPAEVVEASRLDPG